MNGYNNNPKVPYIDLEERGLLVFRDFESLKDQCFLGAARSHTSFLSAKIGQHRTVYKPKDGSIELMTLYRAILADASHECHEQVSKLGPRHAPEYLRYKFPTLYIGTSLSIRNTKNGNYENKHSARDTVNMPCIINFPDLKEEINSWKIFREFGRIIMFANDHHSYTPIHSDWGLQDEFIWIGLSHDKKFFVFDEETETKHFMSGRAMTFNNSDYHGSDPSEHAGISMRVDGIFRDEIREALRTVTS